MNRIPLQDDALAEMGLLKTVMYDCICEAIKQVNAHYELNDDHRAERRRLYSFHIREKFLELLRLEAESNDFFVLDGPGDSFLIMCRSFAIRFYRAFNGHLPFIHAGSSLEDFCNWNCRLPVPRPTNVTLPGFESTVVKPLNSGSTMVHLIAYYEVDASRQLAWLRIACPEGVTHHSIKTSWDTPIVNPLTPGNEDVQVKRSLKTRPDLRFTLRDKDNTSRNEDSSTEMG